MQANPHAWINIAVFDNQGAAKALQSFLEKEGFESRLYDERTLQRYWFLTPPRGGSQVQVRKESFETAKQTLDTKREANALLQKAIRCPSCQSLRVQYPQMTRKFMLPTLVAQVGVFFGVMQRECYCEDCHHTWVKSSRAASRTPVHEKT